LGDNVKKTLTLLGAAAALVLPAAAGAAPTGDVRVTDHTYTSSGTPGYTDSILQECSVSRGRKNEPTVAVDPRNPNVVLGSSNDYCGVYQSVDGVPQPIGPIWLGYYRSTDGGATWPVNSLVPGYPGDTSPAAQRSQARTDGAGDPAIAWDGSGRAFLGSESSNDTNPKTWGDVWVAVYDNPQGPSGPTSLDGSHYVRTVLVQRGSSAKNLLGVFNDKDLINADHTGGKFDGNVYFAFTKFNGNLGSDSIYLSRSTDHGKTFSNPMRVSASDQSVQDADIAIDSRGTVYATWDNSKQNGKQISSIRFAKSTDGGATWSKPATVTTLVPWEPTDNASPQDAPDGPQVDEPGSEDAEAAGTARDCGDFDAACASGYTFFRADLPGPRSTADQSSAGNPGEVWVVYFASKPGTEMQTGTTYGTEGVGTGSQSGAYIVHTTNGGQTWSTPKLLAPESTGHQIFVSADADHGRLDTIWYDSRNDPCYSPTRPIGNCADRTVVPSLDTFGRTWSHGGWGAVVRLSTTTSNPDWEQFSNRTVPFWGDYIDVSTIDGHTVGVWTDGRNIVPGVDQRETGAEDNDGADVKQCRTLDTSTGLWSGDLCPHAGGLDQNIFSRIYN
jgi:hypothetical protein